MQIGQRFLIVDPSKLGHKAFKQSQYALGPVDKSAPDFMGVGVFVAISAFVKEALGLPD